MWQKLCGIYIITPLPRSHWSKPNICHVESHLIISFLFHWEQWANTVCSNENFSFRLLCFLIKVNIHERLCVKSDPNYFTQKQQSHNDWYESPPTYGIWIIGQTIWSSISTPCAPRGKPHQHIHLTSWEHIMQILNISSQLRKTSIWPLKAGAFFHIVTHIANVLWNESCNT